MAPQPSSTDSVSVTTAAEEDVSVQSETAEDAVNSSVELTSPTPPNQAVTNSDVVSRPESADSSVLSEYVLGIKSMETVAPPQLVDASKRPIRGADHVALPGSNAPLQEFEHKETKH
ncbi:hypothetical protein ANCCEY_05516 [Ancylostoma ceylanicum]|uniref:Uncharacterized protein n=1 Tax=Ancylostoma ceylanicum TaxID=53326 RepID=A0A0D6M6A6_9BILA|nr:hypothetical protein ANCCEY_05516 [Ancylostoma ceylanicum]